MRPDTGRTQRERVRGSDGPGLLLCPSDTVPGGPGPGPGFTDGLLDVHRLGQHGWRASARQAHGRHTQEQLVAQGQVPHRLLGHHRGPGVHWHPLRGCGGHRQAARADPGRALPLRAPSSPPRMPRSEMAAEPCGRQVRRLRAAGAAPGGGDRKLAGAPHPHRARLCTPLLLCSLPPTCPPPRGHRGAPACPSPVSSGPHAGPGSPPSLRSSST